MSLYKPPNSENWYLSVSHNGRRIRQTTGTADRKAAQEYHDKLKAELWREEKLGEPFATFGDACADWLTAGDRGESDRYRLRALMSAIGIKTPLSAISAGSVAAALSGKGDANRVRYINLVTAVLNHAKKNGKLTTVPAFIRPKIPKSRIRWLTKDEWKRLQRALAEIAPHLLAPARFAITTGLRMHNVLNLEWSQVNLRRKTALIHPDQAKAGNAIGVPLSNDAMAVLRGQRKLHKKWVFAYGDAPLTRATNHGWKSALKAAKIEGFTWHGLRRTWASWHVMSGTPLPELQRLGAWESYEMVLVYAHLSPSHLATYANNAKPKS